MYTNLEPTISIIMPCFNTAQYLTDTLTSVAAQTFQNFELLMVDDGSTDGTLDVVREWAARNRQFKVIELQQNQGVVAARNAALAQARGEYVAFLDSDDVWLPDALAVRLEVAKSYAIADVIATDFARFEGIPPARPVGIVGCGPRARRAFANSFEADAPTFLARPFELAATTHFVWTGAVLARRSAVTAAGNFDATFKGPEDTLLWLRLALRGAFVFTPQVTAFYRQRAGSAVTKMRGPMELHHLKVLQFLRGKLESAAYAGAIRRAAARYNEVCSLHYRRMGEPATARHHALNAVKDQPHNWRYWRELVAACFEGRRTELRNG